jgi:hypothetical protein
MPPLEDTPPILPQTCAIIFYYKFEFLKENRESIRIYRNILLLKIGILEFN